MPTRMTRTRARVCAGVTFAGHARPRTHARGKQGVDSFTAAVNSIDGFSSCQSAFLLPRERVDRPLFRARVSRADLVYERAVTTHTRTMKYRVMSRLPTTMMCVVVLAMTEATAASPTEPLPSVLLGGIGNVANTATNFLTNAVERPRNLLINATRMTTGVIDSAASMGLEFKLRRFLEKFRARMGNGIPELGIPPLEPFTLDEIDIDTDNPEIGKVNLVIENLELRKLSTFLIDRAKLSLIGPTISINISIPEIFATGYYNISGILGDMYPLRGAGPFETTVRDFRVYVNTVLGYARGMYLKRFDLDFSLRAIKIYLDNFMGGEKIGQIMSKVFEELTPEAMDIIKPDILPPIQDYVTSHVNETIHHLNMRDLFRILLGEYEFGDITHLLIP